MTNEPPNYPPPYPPNVPPADASAPTATQTIPNPGPAWGAPQPAAPAAWSTKKTLAAVGIAVGIALAGGGAVYALSNSSSTTTAQQGFGGAPGAMGGQGQAGQGGMAGGMRGGGMAMALHGVYVVSDGNGGYTTELTQEGTVTAVSDSSLTVKSADGFSQTYTLNSDTNSSSVAVGDTVNVRATQANGTTTATSVRSGQAGRGGFGGAGGRPGGGMPAQGATGTGTTGTATG